MHPLLMRSLCRLMIVTEDVEPLHDEFHKAALHHSTTLLVLLLLLLRSARHLRSLMEGEIVVVVVVVVVKVAVGDAGDVRLAS